MDRIEEIKTRLANFDSKWNIHTTNKLQENKRRNILLRQMKEDMKFLLDAVDNTEQLPEPKQEQTQELFVVKLWTYPDGWINVVGPVTKSEAQAYWNIYTHNGTKIEHPDGSYFKMLPADA